MFTSALKPIARTAARSYSTRSAFSAASSSTFTARHGLIAASTLLAVGGSIAYTSERRTLHLETPSARTSVLDQPSLKVPLHKPSEEQGTKTPEIIEDKKAEAEETSGSQGAFNEETGEINWDCPCLGGMADGPCGEQFKAAFSCFVYSEAEPKGVDCVEKFKHMQDCFRLHPEIYGEEIDDDEESSDLPDGAISGKPLAEGHPDLDKVPKVPNAEPPANSPIPDLTYENTMSKGVSKLQPKGNRSDKQDGLVPSHGDGTA